MSQEDAVTKKTLQVRGDISAERLQAMLEKAGKHGYQLGISIVADPGADPGADPDAGAETGQDEEAPRHGGGEQGP